MLTRKPLARKPFNAQPNPDKGPKPKRCKNRACRGHYLPDPRQPWKDWCSDDCAVVIALERVAKQKAARAKVDRAGVKERRAKLKTRREWIAETQVAFNAYRREVCRIAGYGCICCGAPLDWSGNNVDAGHYRSVGSAPHMRFIENNVWAQTKKCNRFGAGRAVDYRLGLIARIGLEAVEALEADDRPRKYSIEELRAIRDDYRARLRALKASA